MMKIALASDLHLEFEPITLNNDENADVLVLAGDICVAKHANNVLDFFADVASKFKHVVYVVGNHEHYNHLFNDTVKVLRESLTEYNNIHILDNDVYVIDDITFVGGTMWTSMNGEDQMTMQAIVPCMPDWRIIKYFDGVNYYKYTPEQSVREFKRTVDYINHVVAEKHDDKFVVVTHHAPSRKSCHERYMADTFMNGAFNSDLEEFIVYRPQIKAWLHGHTHDPFDYELGTTRVVCNPRGYPKEGQHGLFKLKYIEV